MPHGTPDWGLVGPKQTIYGLDDLAEHAARLGSIVTFDRRGDVLLLDDFEGGASHFRSIISGVGARVRLVSTFPKSGVFHAELTGGSTLKRQAFIMYPRGYPALGNFGLEVSICMPVEIDHLQMWLVVDDAATDWLSGLQWDWTTRDWSYWNDAGEWTPFAHDWITYIPWPPWHTFKLVIDAVNHRYLRAIVNDASYTLGNAPIEAGATVGSPLLFATIDCYSRSGENNYMWVDDVIVTQNEP